MGGAAERAAVRIRRALPALTGCAALLTVAVGCGAAGEAPGPVLPWAAELLGAAPEPEGGPDTDAQVALGRVLFYDPILSVDRDTACATCHSEIWGMSDGLPVSIGTGGGPLTGTGRTGTQLGRRNSPTLWNVAFRETLFWDGRSDSLEHQALLPILEPTELGREPDEVAAELSEIDAYSELFAEAFPEDEGAATSATMARALAAFQRTMISDRAPYDRYVAGDEGALDEASLRGMWLFADAGCDSCHTPPLFESEQFARRLPVYEAGDQGRFEVTQDEADRGSFRVPTLRNLRETEPYFHDGQVADLHEAIAQEVEAQHALGASAALSAEELDDLVTFITKGLMDRSQEPDRPDEVPSGLQVPIDGFRIPR
jgi:cytochrome c peroxidase